ncbi:hypothetical protein CAPTEDRAFT_218081 [Capitella teleta]|uniref:CARD domain-containing protein n=1 Tax=Capitella teleta TaxID=283909 RepID=R7VK88_CAPTE|nr:hypothetical protein CAPTEDRAFT_218081 [Capitella teleta]|eukprot:ELU17131.1 hypothetical protein CAPTEDRAFT_218081 [Capitella teleta]
MYRINHNHLPPGLNTMFHQINILPGNPYNTRFRDTNPMPTRITRQTFTHRIKPYLPGAHRLEFTPKRHKTNFHTKIHGHTRVQTIEALLDHLVKRPDADFNQFCSCLRKTNQGHIAEYLENSDLNASVSSAIAKSETSPTKVKLDESGRRSPKSRREQIKGPRATLERGDAAQLTTGNPDHATSVGPEAAAPVPAPRTKKWRKTAAPQSVTMRMTDEHKAVLTDKRDYLVETISPDNLWTPLRTCRIVTESDEDCIKSHSTVNRGFDPDKIATDFIFSIPDAELKAV